MEKPKAHPGRTGSEMAVWRLRAGQDQRFRAGHPWVYSNELTESPKGLEPGAPVELRDAAGKFLARGYGNPGSLIAFRAMSRDSSEALPLSPEGIFTRLLAAERLREKLGLAHVSHRLCFGEADRLPGLIIDRYHLKAAKPTQVFVVQAHTAGMNRILPFLPELLERLCREETGPAWLRTAIVVRNDVGVRKLEGLAEEPPRVEKAAEGVDLDEARILVHSASGAHPVEYSVNLREGQKTGFFLDQGANVELAARRLAPHPKREGKSAGIRILDLCCYVGQWSTQLTRLYKKAGFHDVEIVAVDASADALAFARRNIAAEGGNCEPLKADVLKGLADLPEKSFDVVIADPPAFIRGRKDLHAGAHAYLQLNTQAFRLVRPGGTVISCSCSSLFEEEDFVKALSKAAHRNGRRVSWIARGSQSPDHPMLAEFPEGRYLKCWIGAVEN